MYYSNRLYQLSNLHEKWRWQFTGSQKCVIRFRTEIGQADDFNSLHDREREESTKSLSLPVTVCYINSWIISDLCSFNLIISACLHLGLIMWEFYWFLGIFTCKDIDFTLDLYSYPLGRIFFTSCWHVILVTMCTVQKFVCDHLWSPFIELLWTIQLIFDWIYDAIIESCFNFFWSCLVALTCSVEN